MLDDIKVPTPEDITSWRKMTFDLLKRSWPVWFAYIVLNCISVAIVLQFHNPVLDRWIWLIYSMTQTIPFFELGFFIAVNSDLQFNWKDGIKTFFGLFTFKKIMNTHFSYIIIIQIFFDLILFGNSNPLAEHSVQFMDVRASIIEKIIIIMLTQLSSIFMIYAVSLPTLGQATEYFLKSYYELETSSRTKLVRQVNDLSYKQYPYRLGLIPWLSLALFALVPVIGLLALPFMITWRYVATRELLFGNGNKSVAKEEEKVHSSSMSHAFGNA